MVVAHSREEPTEDARPRRGGVRLVNVCAGVRVRVRVRVGVGVGIRVRVRVRWCR